MTPPGSARAPVRRRPAVGWAVLVAWLAVLVGVLEWPITHRGYLLGHDMVFTPRQPLDLAGLGVSAASPRAVPLDALVALAEHVVDGAVVGRVAVVLPLLAAGLGCAVVLRSCGWAARAAAATAAVWTPFVVERLALGQWALLWAYAALPWLVVAVRSGRGWPGWAGRAGALAAAAITPTGALIGGAAGVALVVGLRRPAREKAVMLGLAIAVQLPWLVPALLTPAAATSDPAAVSAFAARAEHAGGTVLSLLDGGGIWDADVAPASRSGARPWVWLVLLVVAAVLGWPRLRTVLGRRLLATLGVLGAVGLVLAALPALPGGAAVLRAAVAHVPGAGLLRDSQKWLLPLVLLEALVVGGAVDRVARVVSRRAGRWWVLALGVAAVAAPLLVLPDAAATLRAPFEPVHYPRDWAATARILQREGGDAAVLPFASYRLFPWAPGRSVLDPAPRLLPVATVVDDRLVVSGRVLAGENPQARRVGAALAGARADPAALAAAGIRWVVVEHRTPGRRPDLGGLRLVRAGRDVSLYRVPGRVRALRPATGTVVSVVAGDVLAGGVVIVAVAGGAVAAVRGRRRRRSVPARATGTSPLL